MSSATRIGLTLAQVGPFADPTAVTTMALEAERRGYAELWVLDRLLDPVAPRSAYPGTPDGALPPEQRTALDPLLTLATAAASTTTIRLGTNVLVAPWYRPVLLARSLASLDVLSAGRLDIGLGLGWSADEYAAVGVPQRRLAARQEELLDTLEALWSADPVRYDGSDFAVAPTGVRPKPAQRPRPPVLLAAYTPTGLARAGRRADGWTPAGLDLPTTAALWSVVTGTAAEAGRDPSELSLVVRANVRHTSKPLGTERPTYHGSIEQLGADVRGAFELGAHQVVLELQGSATTVAEYLDLADAITAEAGISAAA